MRNCSGARVKLICWPAARIGGFAAVGLDAARLVGFGGGVGGVGVADGGQAALEVGDARPVGRQGRQVGELVGIRLHVKELRVVANEVDVLPTAVAQQVGGGGGAGGVVFAEDGAIGGLVAGGHGPEVSSGQVRVRSGGCDAGAGHDGGREVDQRHGAVH